MTQATKKKTTKKTAKREPKVEDLDAAIAAELAQDEDDEQEEGSKMASTLNRYRTGYEPTIAYSGRVSLNKGDDVAQTLAGLSPDQVLAAAETLLGLENGELATRYAGLNPGQRRMNGGNRIRAAIKRGDATVKDLQAAVKH